MRWLLGHSWTGCWFFYKLAPRHSSNCFWRNCFGHSSTWPTTTFPPSLIEQKRKCNSKALCNLSCRYSWNARLSLWGREKWRLQKEGEFSKVLEVLHRDPIFFGHWGSGELREACSKEGKVREANAAFYSSSCKSCTAQRAELWACYKQL